MTIKNVLAMAYVQMNQAWISTPWFLQCRSATFVRCAV